MKMLWTGTSTNTKTGNIPQGYIGETKEETLESCDGCPIIKMCYFHTGTPRMAQASMQRANIKRTKRYSLADALANSVRTANYARAAAGGDPNVYTRSTVLGWIRQIKDAGMKGLLNYTHFWDSKGSHLKGLAMASVGSLEEADRACNAGWRAAVVLPVKGSSKHRRVRNVPEWDGEVFTTPEGRHVPICPAQRPGSRKDCNTCGLCDPTRFERVEVIGFLQQ